MKILEAYLAEPVAPVLPISSVCQICCSAQAPCRHRKQPNTQITYNKERIPDVNI